MAAESLGWSPAGGDVDDDDGVEGDHRSGGVDGGSCDAADVLVVHASDSGGGAVASAAAPRPTGPSEDEEGPSSSSHLRSDDRLAGAAAPTAASPPLTRGAPLPSIPRQAIQPGTALGGAAPPRPAGSSQPQQQRQSWPAVATPSSQLPQGTAATANYHRPGTASQRPGNASYSYQQQQRPGTASSSYQLRPGTASYQQRPGTAMGNGGSTKLARSEYLNEHPVLLEYLAKHVLQEGLALAQQVRVQGDPSPAAAHNDSSNGSLVGRLRNDPHIHSHVHTHLCTGGVSHTRQR